ncbi:MAG: sulfatase-like hydrolase/transferase [Bryobacterales bacterium]|nr:sulfatase-like hydrolase/transferase [Bryobacterales bacterium]
MTRRDLLGSLACLTQSAGAQAARRPNVLLIMTDQHRMDALGAYGNQVIRTPNLDALARGGTRFTNCWTQHPVCMPSRASIFTGRYPSAHGVRTNGIRLPRHEVTLAQAMLESGYDTFGAGKFHFIPHYPYRSPLPTMESHPGPYYGFREFHLGEDGRSGEHWMWIQKTRPEFHGKPDHEIPPELHNSQWVASHTANFIRRSAVAAKPFFAFASFVDPHHSYNPPPPYRDMYQPRDMPPVRARAEEREAKPPHYRDLYDMYAKWGDPARHRAQYYGEVTFIDDSVGRILRALDESGVRDNTLIVFTSDHGDLLGDHHLYTKGPFHYRHCAAVPLIVNWPGRVRPGKTVEGMVQQIDLLPTIADLAGVRVPDGVQGRSQRAVLTSDSADTGYTSALIEYGTSGVSDPAAGDRDRAPVDLCTLVTRQWRLSYYPAMKTGELYDLSSDPDEFRNLWAMTRHDRIQRELKDELLDRVLMSHDPLPRREKPY